MKSLSLNSVSFGVKRHLSVILRLLLDGDVGRKRQDGAAVPHLDHRRLIRGIVRTVTGRKKVVGAALVVGMEVRGLEVALPPQNPQNLLLQNGLDLRAALELLQLFGVLADVEALDLLVGALYLLRVALIGRRGAVALQVKPQTAQVDVVALAVGAFVRALAGVQALVQLEVDELGELCRAELAVVRLLPRVQTQVSLQVAGAAEALVTNLEEEKRQMSRPCSNKQRWEVAEYKYFVTSFFWY